MGKLKVDHIFKEYEKGKLVISDVCLEIDEGDFFVLLGPSGCGKTTLLNIIAGIEPLTSGKVFIDNEDCTYLVPQKRNISVVFQDYSLYPNMTVFKNISFPLKNQKISRNIIKEKVERVGSLLRIEDILHSSVERISGGQKQRVAIARAIVREPRILLMDEPLSNLDATLKAEIRDELLELHKTLKPTIIYVTHDQAEALTLATKLAIMREGRIEQVGLIEELFYHPQNEYIGTFLGIPKMLLHKYKLLILFLFG